MNPTTEFETLIYSKKEVLPFLEKLTIEERKKLVPKVKKLQKELCQYRTQANGKYGRKGTSEQIVALNYAGIYCFDFKTYARLFIRFPEDYFKDKKYKNFRPDWLEAYLNNEESIWYLRYQDLLELILNYDVRFSSQTIAQVLCDSYYFYDYDTRDYSINKSLFDNPLTLKEHVWLLFQEETNINWKDEQWTKAFKNLVKTSKINKQLLLKACLLTSTKNFNKTLTGYFFDVFTVLNPTETELLELQNELCIALNGQHSKPINTVLKYLKTLCLHKDFNAKLFLESVPVLLTFDVKAVVNNTLMILDKLAKKDKRIQVKVCEHAAQALIQQDEKLQTRAAKIISKYGIAENEILTEQITLYYPELFSGVKSMLSAYVSEEETESQLEETFGYEILLKLDDSKLISIPETFDDMVFFVSQSFENNEVYHFDIFMGILPHFFKLLNKDNIHKLEPALNRALKLDIWSSRIGFTENAMATLFLDIIEKVAEEFTDSTVATIFKKAKTEENALIEKWRNVHRKLIPVENLKYGKECYKILVELLAHCKKITMSKLDVVMLSTPTHLPCYISIQTFIERLAVYQKANQELCAYDFQIALARLVLDERQISDEELQIISGEYLDIMMYLLDKKSLDFSECKSLSLWLIAIYRKQDREALYKFIETKANNTRAWFLYLEPVWRNEIKQQQYKEYNYSTKKNENVTRDVKDLQIKYLPHKSAKVSEKRLEKIKNFFKLSNKESIKNFYSHFISLSQRGHLHPHDIPKFLSFSPFNPSIISYHLIHVYYNQTSWIGADEEKATLYAFPLLSDIWREDFDEISYLYLACGLLFGKKQGAQIAAELWVKAVAQSNIKNDVLGQVLGKLQSTEYAPMKRLTDLIINSMFNISKTHNKALEELVANCISKLGDVPIRGTKKLLEIYHELLTLNNSKATPKVNKRIEAYKTVGSLKGVVKKLST